MCTLQRLHSRPPGRSARPGSLALAPLAPHRLTLPEPWGTRARCRHAHRAGTIPELTAASAPCARRAQGHHRDHRTRIQEPCRAGLQPHPAHRRGLCRPRDPALAVPEARRRRAGAQLPARKRGGRRALRALFLHRPAGAHAAARQRLHDRSRDRRRSGRDHDGNPLDFIAAYQQRFKVALRPGLPRFCGGLAGYFGYDAVRYIEPKLAKTWKPAASTRPTSCCCRPRNWPSSTTCRGGCT
jgi:hypothetical protein